MRPLPPCRAYKALRFGKQEGCHPGARILCRYVNLFDLVIDHHHEPRHPPSTIATVVSPTRCAARTSKDSSARTATRASGTLPIWPSRHPLRQISATAFASSRFAARSATA